MDPKNQMKWIYLLLIMLELSHKNKTENVNFDNRIHNYAFCGNDRIYRLFFRGPLNNAAH